MTTRICHFSRRKSGTPNEYLCISFCYYLISFSSDKKTDAGLNRRDLSGRPFGAVFNLHKDYSKIFIGGYPFDAGVQRTMQSTNMNGQIESLKIGKEVQIVYRGWEPKFATGLIYQIGHSSKSVWVTRLLFCQNG